MKNKGPFPIMSSRASQQQDNLNSQNGRLLRLVRNDTGRRMFLFAVSALLLTVIQAPTDWSFLAWVAYVPFVAACSPRVRPRTLALARFTGPPGGQVRVHIPGSRLACISDALPDCRDACRECIAFVRITG